MILLAWGTVEKMIQLVKLTTAVPLSCLGIMKIAAGINKKSIKKPLTITYQ